MNLKEKIKSEIKDLYTLRDELHKFYTIQITENTPEKEWLLWYELTEVIERIIEFYEDKEDKQKTQPSSQPKKSEWEVPENQPEL